MLDAEQVYKELDSEAQAIRTQARLEYATAEDPLDNFRVIASLLGLTPRQVLKVYFLKHVLSFVRGGTLREPMRGRRIDMMNYIRLDQLMEEEATAQVKPVPSQGGKAIPFTGDPDPAKNANHPYWSLGQHPCNQHLGG